jgi:thymidylate synthase
MNQYLEIVKSILERGVRKENRTGVDTLSLFNVNYEIDLDQGFPLLTTKKISWKNIVIENLWFLSGSRNINLLLKHGCKFWSPWADTSGNVPSAYGHFHRRFPTGDRMVQIDPRVLEVPAQTTKDPFDPSISQVGYGGSTLPVTVLDKNLYQEWSRMLERCYSPQCEDYKLYGAKGVFVCESWFSFTQFRKDCHSLPGWIDKLNSPSDFQLDKDYYSSNCYSRDTCVWLSKSDSDKYQDTRDLFRYHFPTDQIRWVIDQLKTNPNSRRLVVSAWDPTSAIHSQLPPCHAFWVLNATPLDPSEGTPYSLNLHLTQRSCDVGLGLAYNISGYSFLMSLFARFAGMKVGHFAHSIVDTHIYISKPDGSMEEYDHRPGLREQLNRTPRKLPRLIIAEDIRSLEDVENLLEYDTETIMSKFRLEGYDPHPAVNFKVAV